jgi:serine/threonine-protein kinase
MTGDLLHYRILKKLGSGGMGEVFLADDTKLHRKVAIKVVRPDAPGAGDAGRQLLREARAAAALSHPGICSIHEVGEADGRSFIVMEYVEGETLDTLLTRGPIGVDRALEIAAEIADALAVAHARGIVHRDIKPANVIVTARGPVKVMDFGLARAATAPASDAQTESRLTTPGEAAGTVPYMSPEQLRGEPVDHRADLFSAGVLLYEAVSGRRPFQADSAIETASAILSSDPPPLSRLGEQVPDELQRIVRKCLQKARDRRYQTASDLKLDLETLRRGASPSVQAAAPAAKRRAGGIAAALVGLLTVGAVAAWLAFRPRATVVPPQASIGSIAVFPFTNAGDADSEYVSDGITESLINNFSRLPTLRVIARTTMFRYKGKNPDPLAIGRELGVDAALTGRVFPRGDALAVQVDFVRVADGAQLWGDRFDRKRADVLAIEDEIARQIAERLRGRLSGSDQAVLTRRHAVNADAYDIYLKGGYALAKPTEASVDDSVQLFQRAIAIDPSFARAHVALANAYFTLGGVFGFRSPREMLPRAADALAQALRLEPDLAEAHTGLGRYKFLYERNWADAEREFKTALALNPNSAATYTVLGSFYHTQGRIEEAIAAKKAAHALDPFSPLAASEVGYPYYYGRRYDEAITHFRKAIELEPSYSWAHLFIGQAYVQKGMLKDAIATMQEALRLSGGDVRVRSTLGHAYAVSGDRTRALAVLNDLTGLSAKAYVSPYFLAVVYSGLKDAGRTFAQLDAAFEERHPYLNLLKVEPIFDWLRTDPRFAALEKRVGLR